MYRLLLVDDEKATREGIEAGIDWQAHQVSEIRTANNGVNALEIAKTYRPDILITDIKMPKMSGLELARQIREYCPKCSIIIVSGYPEAEYLRSVIQIKAIDFIDKPVDLVKLAELVDSAAEEQAALYHNLQLLRRDQGEKLFFQYTEENQSPLPFPLENTDEMQIVILRFLSLSGEKIMQSEIYSRQESIESFFRDELYKDDRADYCIASRDNDIFLVLFCTGDLSTQLVDWARKSFRENTVYFGISEKSCFGEFRTKFANTMHGIEQMFFSPEKKVWDKPQPPSIHSSNQSKSRIDEWLKTFSNYIGEMQTEEAKKLILSIEEELSTSYSGFTPKQVKYMFYRMFELIFRQNAKLSDMFSPDNENESMLEWLSDCVFLTEIVQAIIREIDRLISNEEVENPMKAVVDLIHAEYSDKSLSLSSVSKQFYLSGAYLCVLFKAYTGKTFVQYLTEYRLSIATQLLANKHKKINEIAEETGFDNGNYFSKQFKKYMDLSPAEYRKGL